MGPKGKTGMKRRKKGRREERKEEEHGEERGNEGSGNRETKVKREEERG